MLVRREQRNSGSFLASQGRRTGTQPCWVGHTHTYGISAASTEMPGHKGRLVNPTAGDTCTHFICDKDLTPLGPTVVKSREGGTLVSFQFLTTGLSWSPLTPTLVLLRTGAALIG